jgi:hypothetical protein
MINQILQSQSGDIIIDIYYNGILTNPTSCIIKTITDPDDVVILTDQETEAGTTTGRRIYTVDSAHTVDLGVYTAIWEFILNEVTYQHTQSYEVVTSIRSGYCVPQEVRDNATYGKITSTSPTDTMLEKYIRKAMVLIDNYLGGSLEYSQYINNVNCVIDKRNGGLHIQLPHRPILSVTSVTINTLPNITARELSLSNLRINYDVGYIEYFGDYSISSLNTCYGKSYTGIVPVASVNYTAGYTSIPEPIMLASVYLIEQMIRSDNNDDNWLESFKIGDYTERYQKDRGNKSIGKIGSDIVKDLLIPYKQPTQSGFYPVTG